MKQSKLEITADSLTVFQNYLLSNSNVKKLCQEFDFYHILFYKEMYTSNSIVSFVYPTANLYWFLDFKAYVEKNIIPKDTVYKEDWIKFFIKLKSKIKEEYDTLKWQLDHLVRPQDVINYQIKYNLRDYQAFDLCQLLIKYKYWDNNALILSEQRTGKTRVAIAAYSELFDLGSINLIVCPKSAVAGWETEFKALEHPLMLPFEINVIKSMSTLKTLKLNSEVRNVRIISYDLFKKLTTAQIRQLVSKSKDILFTVDEVHRLRNFKTDQSTAIFNFKEYCEKDNVNLGLIGMTGTPGVKEDTDIFGTLSFINNSKINFNPFWYCLDSFKEYFYYCEDTSFGKKARALKREAELNFIIQLQSIQTKQKDLEFFKNYKKVYKKIELDMDTKQKEIYDSVYEKMEYEDDIDCQNKLVQLVRLQQICIDPSGLTQSYDLTSPKLKYVVKLLQTNNLKFIITCKKVVPLKHLMELLEKENIEYASYIGEYNFTKRKEQLDKFNEDSCRCILLQLDAGKEALTLPKANAIVFLDRDFAQGYNEQAEARMTPIDGSSCTKYVIDLVMKNTKEEEIYQTLVIRKKSITNINTIFTKKES